MVRIEYLRWDLIGIALSTLYYSAIGYDCIAQVIALQKGQITEIELHKQENSTITAERVNNK